MKKSDQERIAQFLQKNQAPKPLPEKVFRLKQEVRHQAESIPFAVLQHSSLPDRLLRQLPYISPWIWPVQLLVLLLFFLLLRQQSIRVETLVLLSSTGPLLAILPMADSIRSFGCNMWEMEAACRYDLRQITAMRLCIVGGGDILVLAFGSCLYGQKMSALWGFGLYILLPFLVSSCIYLQELNHFPGKYSACLLVSTGIGVNLTCCFLLGNISGRMHAGDMKWLPAVTGGAVIAFSAATVYSAVSLCTNLKKKEGVIKWNLE